MENLNKIIQTLSKRKPTHANFKKIDSKLKELGFKKIESFYDSKSGTARGSVDDGGLWVKDEVKIKTNFIINYDSYSPLNLSISFN